MIPMRSHLHRKRWKSFDECLHDVRELDDSQLSVEFDQAWRAWSRHSSSNALAVCFSIYFFLGFHTVIPKALRSFSQRFDTSAELAAALHAAMLVPSLVLVYCGRPGLSAAVWFASSISLYFAFARIRELESLVKATAAFAEDALRDHLSLHPSRSSNVVRELGSLAAFALHDMWALVISLAGAIGVFVLARYCAAESTGSLVVALVAVVLTICNLGPLTRAAARPPYLLVLGNSADTRYTTIYTLREACFPGRVSNLLDLNKARSSRISPRADYLRCQPDIWASLVWQTVVHLELRAAAMVVFYELETQSNALMFEKKLLVQGGIRYLTVSRLGGTSPIFPSRLMQILRQVSWFNSLFSWCANQESEAEDKLHADL